MSQSQGHRLVSDFPVRGRSVRFRTVCDGLNTKSGEAESYE